MSEDLIDWLRAQIDDDQRMATAIWDDLLRLLAAIFSDRPGYREEWRP